MHAVIFVSLLKGFFISTHKMVYCWRVISQTIENAVTKLVNNKYAWHPSTAKCVWSAAVRVYTAQISFKQYTAYTVIHSTA